MPNPSEHTLREVYFNNLNAFKGTEAERAELGYTPNLEALEDLMTVHNIGGRAIAGTEPEATESIAAVQPPKKLYELPGQNRGRSNSPLPTRTEILKGMSPEDIARQDATNKRGAEQARAALRDRTS